MTDRLTIEEVKALGDDPEAAVARFANLGWVDAETAYRFTRANNTKVNVQEKLRMMTHLALHLAHVVDDLEDKYHIFRKEDVDAESTSREGGA